MSTSNSDSIRQAQPLARRSRRSNLFVTFAQRRWPIAMGAAWSAGARPFPAGWRKSLEQILAPPFLERLNDLAYLLGAVARGHQESVGRVHHDQVIHPNQRHHFAAGIHKIILRIDQDRFVRDCITASVEGLE